MNLFNMDKKENTTENILDDNQDFYLAVKDRNEFIVYESDGFKLSEIDIINLIKICLIERRSKTIGERILSVYKDSTNHKKELVIKKLKLIGIDTDNEKTTTISNRNTKKK
jgi:site-specific recombinase XerC